MVGSSPQWLQAMWDRVHPCTLIPTMRETNFILGPYKEDAEGTKCCSWGSHRWNVSTALGVVGSLFGVPCQGSTAEVRHVC